MGTILPKPQTTQPDSSTMSDAQLIAHYKAQNEALQARVVRLSRVTSLKCKVSEKGALSVYGLGRFPVTLYGAQWSRLAAFMDQIVGFIDANRASLSVKA